MSGCLPAIRRCSTATGEVYPGALELGRQRRRLRLRRFRLDHPPADRPQPVNRSPPLQSEQLRLLVVGHLPARAAERRSLGPEGRCVTSLGEEPDECRTVVQRQGGAWGSARGTAARMASGAARGTSGALCGTHLVDAAGDVEPCGGAAGGVGTVGAELALPTPKVARRQGLRSWRSTLLMAMGGARMARRASGSARRASACRSGGRRTPARVLGLVVDGLGAAGCGCLAELPRARPPRLRQVGLARAIGQQPVVPDAMEAPGSTVSSRKRRA